MIEEEGVREERDRSYSEIKRRNRGWSKEKINGERDRRGKIRKDGGKSGQREQERANYIRNGPGTEEIVEGGKKKEGKKIEVRDLREILRRGEIQERANKK